jgi:PTS system cellobiose-specific IIA component
MDSEEIVFTIISHAGNAKSMCFQALRLARKGNFDDAEKFLNEAKNELYKTHDIQNKMIQEETSGKGQKISLLLVHAEDHLMSAMLVKDLITEMIEMCKENKKLMEMIIND